MKKYTIWSIVTAGLFLTTLLFPGGTTAGEKEDILSSTTLIARGANGLFREVETTGVNGGSCLSITDLTVEHAPKVCVSVIQKGQINKEQCREFPGHQVSQLDNWKLLFMFLTAVKELCVPHISSTGST